MRDIIFDVARFWGVSPFEVEARSISDVVELVEQANRIYKKEMEAWQQAKLTR